MALLTSSNYKTKKGEKVGIKTLVLHLAPYNLSGFQVCPKASVGCSLACLNMAGMGIYSTVQQARIKKTREFFLNREKFMTTLADEIYMADRSAKKAGMKLAIRLNGTSDIAWEKIRVTVHGVEFRNLMEAFPEIQFYDYTAIVGRTVPDNYYLTFSKKESNDLDVSKALQAGMNVAVVFDITKKESLPRTYQGASVIDGDVNDVRFTDASGVIIGLRLKGTNKNKASARESGFAVKI